MKKIILIMFVLVVKVVFSYDMPSITISVYGISSEFESNVPSEYEIEIYKEGESPDSANQKATEAHDNVISKLIELKIPEDNIVKNNNLQSHFNDKSCFARKTITVTIPAGINKDDLLSAVIEAGATGYNDFSRFRFGPGNITGSNEKYPQSKKEAAKVAKRKADELADAFGAQVGRIISLRDLDYGHQSNNEFRIEVTYELIY